MKFKKDDAAKSPTKPGHAGFDSANETNSIISIITAGTKKFFRNRSNSPSQLKVQDASHRPSRDKDRVKGSVYLQTPYKIMGNANEVRAKGPNEGKLYRAENSLKIHTKLRQTYGNVGRPDLEKKTVSQIMNPPVSKPSLERAHVG